MSKYEVRFFINSSYEVINKETGEKEFQGSLADCEAYIRLKEKGQM